MDGSPCGEFPLFNLSALCLPRITTDTKHRIWRSLLQLDLRRGIMGGYRRCLVRTKSANLDTCDHHCWRCGGLLLQCACTRLILFCQILTSLIFLGRCLLRCCIRPKKSAAIQDKPMSQLQYERPSSQPLREAAIRPTYGVVQTPPTQHKSISQLQYERPFSQPPLDAAFRPTYGVEQPQEAFWASNNALRPGGFDLDTGRDGRAEMHTPWPENRYQGPFVTR